MSEPFRRIPRERVLAFALLFMVVVFAGRLVQLQLFQHSQWRNIARDQSLTTRLQKPSRGEIRDRNQLALAVTLPLTYAVGYRPQPALDRNSLAATLSPLLQKPRRELREKLDSPGFTYLARRVDWQVKQKLENLGLKCFQFDEEPRRSYPSGRSAAVVVGFTNVDGTGQEGIEAVMNEELSGEGYRELCRVDALRKTAAPLNPLPAELKGADVTLSLDLQLQTLVEEKLNDGLRGKGFERACAVMVDPQTGDVLALVTLPSYDPNRPGDARPQERKCWPITDVYEPGSTLKIVPVAKALESGKLHRASQIFCENGNYPVRGAVIHDSHPHGTLTLDDVLAYSSNIGAAKVCQKFSPDEVFDKLRAFGFGNLTNVGILGEQPGVIPPPSSWSGPTQATLAFGQGISCTALQLTMAYAAVANGGLLMKPRLVQSVTFPNGQTTPFKPEVIRRVIPENVAADLTDMLCKVVEYGTGTKAKVEGLRIAGKTGTAEKVDHEHHSYYSNRYVSSFVGYFPADKPQYVMLVVVDDPRGEHYGGSVAGPVFKAVAEELKLSWSPAPSRPQIPTDMVAYHKTPSQSPPRNAAQNAVYDLSTRTAELATYASLSGTAADSTLVTVPSLEGWTLRKAVVELAQRKLGFKLVAGSGTVLTQFPPAGTRVPAGTVCELYGVNG